VRVRIDRHARPLERQLGGDLLRTRPLEELHEAFHQPAVLGHLGPEPATEAQIISQRVAERHAAPPSCDGHGRASARSALRSTFAYCAVVFCSLAQHLADLRERCALAEHLRRRGVPELVRTHARQPRPIARLAHDPPDRPWRQPPKRRGHAHKQRAALAPRAAAQIRHDRFAEIDGQQQLVITAALPADQQ
jgi:hypothetical protein